MGQPRAKYGGVLVKKTEQGSELRLTGMAWRDMITDQVEVRSGPGADLRRGLTGFYSWQHTASQIGSDL